MIEDIPSKSESQTAIPCIVRILYECNQDTSVFAWDSPGSCILSQLLVQFSICPWFIYCFFIFKLVSSSSNCTLISHDEFYRSYLHFSVSTIWNVCAGNKIPTLAHDKTLKINRDNLHLFLWTLSSHIYVHTIRQTHLFFRDNIQGTCLWNQMPLEWVTSDIWLLQVRDDGCRRIWCSYPSWHLM